MAILLLLLHCRCLQNKTLLSCLSLSMMALISAVLCCRRSVFFASTGIFIRSGCSTLVAAAGAAAILAVVVIVEVVAVCSSSGCSSSSGSTTNVCNTISYSIQHFQKQLLLSKVTNQKGAFFVCKDQWY